MTSTAPSANSSPDTLLLDLPRAEELAHSLVRAEDELAIDHLALRPMLHEASVLLGNDRNRALGPLAAARQHCADLAADLWTRLDLVDTTLVRLERLDELTHAIDSWPRRLDDVARLALVAQRRRLLLEMAEGDEAHAKRLEFVLGSGVRAAEAFRVVDAEFALADRVVAVMDAFSIDEAAARAMIERADTAMAELLARGFAHDDAVAAVAIVERFGLDLEQALDHAAAFEVPILEVLGRMLTAQAIGVTLLDYEAVSGLTQHFEVFDRAKGAGSDDRVSADDLRFIIGHPRLFTPSQVLAAQQLLDRPALWNRLDTANANDEIFGPGGFGETEPGDGLVGDVDLQAFLLKSQLRAVLGDYADEIDIANDPSGIVDGFRSENDFKAFIANNPDVPPEVLEAATIALESGWFDESWWSAHKDEIAMGIALLAAGAVVVVTGGAASIVLVVGVAGAAAGATTVAINLATGEPMLDEVFMNTVKGGFIGTGVHGVSAGVVAHGTATTGVARVAAISGATSGAADVVAAGGLDLLIEEKYEAAVHDVANEISMATGTADAAHGLAEWSSRRMATFETVDDQLAALSEQVSHQRQLRHVADSSAYRHGGYFDDPADAQRVLDAVHDGSAEVIGITRGQDLLVRYDGVTGVHVNHRPMPTAVETSTFTIKGTAAVSVVPVLPGRVE